MAVWDHGTSLSRRLVLLVKWSPPLKIAHSHAMHQGNGDENGTIEAA
jgi:hypothetical protein